MNQFQLFSQISDPRSDYGLLAPEGELVFRRCPANLVAEFITISDQLVEFRLGGIPGNQEIVQGFNFVLCPKERRIR